MASRNFSCCELFKKIKEKIQYFGNETNLHGVGHIFPTNTRLFKRLFWLAVIVCTSYGAALIFRESLKLFKATPISFTVETSYLDWDTPFPAVTVCENMDTDRIHNYLHQKNMSLSMGPFYKEISFWNSKFCKTCSSCKINQSCLENIPQLVNDFRLKCHEIFLSCWWDDKWFQCCDRFRPLQTELGTCYTFNSQLTGNGSDIIYLNRRVGLKTLVFSVNEFVAVRIHSPDETISVASENLLGKQSQLPLISDFEVFLKVEETTNDYSVKKLPPETRGCLLWWDRPKFAKRWNVQRYSYSACVLYCRTEAQADHCNCTHHFMPPLEGVPVCDIQGLVCLNKIKDFNTISCDCPMACEETFYKLAHAFNTRHTGALPEALQKRGSMGRVHLADLPTLRVRRQAIRDMLSLVVDVGGVGGVFFGASVLSVIEIVYLLCIRRQI